MRKVTIYSSNLGNGLSFDTDVTSFGQLQTVFMEKGVSYNNMKVVIGETRVTLEHPDAVLPEGDFKVFLLPMKTKSGKMSRTEIYNEIKKLKNEKGDAFVKENFGNYTQTSSEDLVRKLANIKKPLAKSLSEEEISEEEVCEQKVSDYAILLEIKEQLSFLTSEVSKLVANISSSSQDEDENDDDINYKETVYEKEAEDLLNYFN